MFRVWGKANPTAEDGRPPGGPEKAAAIYLFSRTGEPLVAMASGRSLPIETEQLEGLLSVVGHFAEPSPEVSGGYATSALAYDDLGILAVRGRHMIAAAVYERPAEDGLRDELLRVVQSFESRRARTFRSLEGTVRTAERAADELSRLLPREPERATRPRRSIAVPGAHAR